jgi:hypothetical protein
VGKKRKQASVGSTKSRTGHLVETFFDVAIVVEIDGQISRRAVAVVVVVVVRRRSSLFVVVAVYSAEYTPHP